jgi:hypothetical protein
VAFRQPDRVQPAAVGEARGGQDGRVLVPVGVVRVVAEEVQAEVRGGLPDVGRGRLHQRVLRHRGRDPRQRPPGRRNSARLTRQEAAAAQVVHRVADGVDDEIHVGVGVRGGQEEVAPLPDVHAFHHQVVEQQFQVAAVGEPEQRAEPLHRQRQLTLGEEVVQRLRQPLGTGGHGALQAGPLVAQVGQHGLGRHHGQRVLDVGAAEEGGLALRNAVIAVLPVTAVDPVHDLGAAGDGADRVAAADQLAVGGQVGPDAEDPLRALRVRTEAGEHLVEHQHDAGLVAQPAQLADELDRLPVRIAAGHGFQHHGRDFPGMPADHVQAGLVAVAEHHHLRDRRLRHAG